MIDRIPGPAARRLEAALSGYSIGEPADDLVSLAGELRELGLDVPIRRPAAEAREELALAVLARKRETQCAGGIARVRGATFALAGVAGAGLVVASAASGSNPVVLVADAARELPRIAGYAAPPATVAIEGEVVASHDGGRTLDVRADGETITVEAPKQARSVTSSGTPVSAANIAAGDSVRVTAEREPGNGPVAAKKIEVLPPALAASTGDRPPGNSATQAPAVSEPTRPASGRTPSATPRPADTPKPAPTFATAVAASDPAIASVPPVVPTRTPTPKPTATPTHSPTPKPAVTLAPAANETNNVAADPATDSDADKRP